MGINISSSVAGMRSALTSQSVRANNVSNVNSRGYKSKKPVQSDTGGSGPKISSVSANFSQGSIRLTNRPSDIALDGAGFFQVSGKGGEKLYTRSLSLQQDGSGRLRPAGPHTSRTNSLKNSSRPKVPST